ncbi:putative secreted protein (Por secretion system target) [Dyadobacter jejuensis]|uniref:Putative secreted protein (Por secretion system target) n=1 Tax=Dyadobacter jejuensis TaxID=1082580 RepID=A0A316BDD0_9BACT|nr:T9SS type A sorting domain-containing protein [Dyadobacter jejuensis]PWJ60497.1 putative secreted protein (Por secretion system target) [Dyadobacter jejuensis]
MDLGIVSASALPVTLISFESEIVRTGVELRWRTTDEKACSHFELQKSSNALEFASLGSIEGSSLGAYNFTDSAPLKGINYYRLKMVNQDRSAELSKIIAVDYSADAIYTMVQNPSQNGSFTVYTNLTNPKFTLVHVSGKQVHLTVSRTHANQYQLTLKNYTEGVYVLRFESGGTVINKKILVK